MRPEVTREIIGQRLIQTSVAQTLILAVWKDYLDTKAMHLQMKGLGGCYACNSAWETTKVCLAIGLNGNEKLICEACADKLIAAGVKHLPSWTRLTARPGISLKILVRDRGNEAIRIAEYSKDDDALIWPDGEVSDAALYENEYDWRTVKCIHP